MRKSAKRMLSLNDFFQKIYVYLDPEVLASLTKFLICILSGVAKLPKSIFGLNSSRQAIGQSSFVAHLTRLHNMGELRIPNLMRTYTVQGCILLGFLSFWIPQEDPLMTPSLRGPCWKLGCKQLFFPSVLVYFQNFVMRV